MSRLCIIPARGGSKRIPRKNIKPFLGKPVIAYSIEAAISSGLFDEVMVSTDDEEIADVAITWGAKVPVLRSDINSNDTASTLDALQEVLNWYSVLNGQDFTEVCCIYAAAPFINPNLLVEAQRLLTVRNYDCVFPVMQYNSPVQRSLTLDKSNRIQVRYKEYVSYRTQDLEPVYHDAGMFYFFCPEPIARAATLWTENTGGIPISEFQAHDIDTETDWALAELKYGLLYQR